MTERRIDEVLYMPMKRDIEDLAAVLIDLALLPCRLARRPLMHYR